MVRAQPRHADCGLFSPESVYAPGVVLLPVGKMLVWWKHVIILLLVEGGTDTSGGDLPDHQDIIRMQDRWKEYRNIVRGGFFFNDSVIVMADYSDAEPDGGHSNDEHNDDISRSEQETKIENEYHDDEKDSRDILKVDIFIYFRKMYLIFR